VRSEDKVKALEYLNLANQKAAKAYALEEAKTYFNQAMDLLDTMPDTQKNREYRISLLVNSSVVFVFQLQISEYYELLTRYEPLVEGIDNTLLAGSLYNSLGLCEWFFGSYDSVIQNGKRAAELWELGEDVEAVGRAFTVQMCGHLGKGDLQRVLALKEEATRSLYNNLDEWFNRWHAQGSLLWASLANIFLGRWNEAIESGRELLRLAQEYSDEGLMAHAARNLCQVYTFEGDLDRAIEYGEMGVGRASTPADKVYLQAALAWAKCRAGQLVGNIERLAEVVQLYRDAKFGSLQVSYMPMLAEGYLLAGEYEKARETVQEVVELAENQGAKAILGWASRLLGDIVLKTIPEDAVPHFEKAISISQEIKAENELALAYSGMGRYHKHQGNTAQAREYLTKALEIFERLGTLIEPDKVREELAELDE
jgi:tetratricopeptide (TPR) repeat protein